MTAADGDITVTALEQATIEALDNSVISAAEATAGVIVTNIVLSDADQHRFAPRLSRQQLLDGGVAQNRAQVAVKGAWRPSPLHVA
mgnify:CR=1 FL=1